MTITLSGKAIALFVGGMIAGAAVALVLVVGPINRAHAQQADERAKAETAQQEADHWKETAIGLAANSRLGQILSACEAARKGGYISGPVYGSDPFGKFTGYCEDQQQQQKPPATASGEISYQSKEPISETVAVTLWNQIHPGWGDALKKLADSQKQKQGSN